MFIVEPIGEAEGDGVRNKLTIRYTGKKQPDADVTMMQAIMKLAFFAANRYDRGGYENNKYLYVPAIKKLEQDKTSRASSKSLSRSKSRRKLKRTDKYLT